MFEDGSLGEHIFRNGRQSHFQVPSVGLVENEHKSSITDKQSSCQNTLFFHYVLTSVNLGLQISKGSLVISDHHLQGALQNLIDCYLRKHSAKDK